MRPPRVIDYCLLLAATLSFNAVTALLVDLTTANFDAAVKEVPEDNWALIEFFASWCPACRHFAPTYEAVADAVNAAGPNAKTYVARVDCATEQQLCSRFDVRGYPSVLLAHPSSFLAGSDPKPELLKGDRSTAKAVLKWVSSVNGRSYDPATQQDAELKENGGQAKEEQPDAQQRANHVDVVNQQVEQQPGADSLQLKPSRQVAAAEQVSAPAAHKVDLTDVVTATIASWRSTVDNPALMNGVESRQALKDFLDLLATAHPVKQCRQGAEHAESYLSKAWPDADKSPKNGSFKKVNICGKLTEQEWGSCRGSSPSTRGYTCGMWLLFHTLAANLKGDNDGALWVTSVRGFMKNFFPCNDCSQHFEMMAASNDALLVQTPDDAVLWSWRAHNQVNERVRKDEEQAHDGDPAFPKVQWPSREACPSCHTADTPDGWDEAAVLMYLRNFYSGGGSLPKGSRWHMQMHRKAAWSRSERFKGRMFHGERIRGASILFWLLVIASAVLAVVKACPGCLGNAGSRRAANGKFRHH